MLELLTNQEVIHIILLTLRMTLLSTAISATLGIPLGLLLEKARFPGKKIVVTINRTLMATPPVVAGLVVFMVLRSAGPLGRLELLFTFEAMVIAQTVLITPIICGIVYTATVRHGNRIRSFAKTMGANKLQTEWLLMKELGNEIFFSVVTGFGRAMSEVGAIMIVGGNIRFHTRTMNTSITMMQRMGEFEQAILFGVLLMIIAFIIQLIGSFLQRKEQQPYENF
jgi:tungstate transport system permease protein